MDSTDQEPTKETTFEEELQNLINRYSLENNSDTPDFILAQYLLNCMYNFNKATQSRDKWYNFKPNATLSNLEGRDGDSK